MTIRRIAKVFKSRPTIEGAGVHLKRAFGYSQVPQFDPFLMLDDFHTSNPDEYRGRFRKRKKSYAKPIVMAVAA